MPNSQPDFLPSALPDPMPAPLPDASPAPAARKRRTAALLVIGNEILSGKTADTNTGVLARLLRTKGLELRRVVTIGDDPAAIAEEVAALRGAHDLVFTSGGVGGTHDDVTMEGVARAFGVPVTRHPGFLDALRERGLGEGHRDLARAPAGAELRSSADCGFPVVVMDRVWILPGLPPAFRQKMGVLDACLPTGAGWANAEERVPGPEERLIPLLNRIVAEHPEVQVGSYPGDGETRVTFDADDEAAVQRAASAFRESLRTNGATTAAPGTDEP